MSDPIFEIADEQKEIASRVIPMIAMIIVANVMLWIFAGILLHGHPILISTAILAYILGLRHAIDPDHLAAIDNVTRKLASEGKVPIGVGFCFALGHSAFVLLVIVLLTVSAIPIDDIRLASLQSYGDMVSTCVSTVFLLSIGILNLKALRDMRHGDQQTMPPRAMARLWTRFIAPLFADIRNSRGMIFIGFLFALSFDTATEISLFSMSAAHAVGHTLPLLQILIFPILFAAGMTLVDMINGVTMLGAYRWSSQNKNRHRQYNIFVTGLSAFLAISIGGAGLVQMLIRSSTPASEFHIFGDRPEIFGAAMIALFIIIWSLAIVADRTQKLSSHSAE